MEIDFNEYIKQKIEFYESLKKIEINNEQFSSIINIENEIFKKINLDFEDFILRRKQKERLSAKENNDFKKKLISLYPDFKKISDCNNPAIYWFKIRHFEKSDNKKLLKKFVQARNPKNGWWSKPTKDNENLTEYLYLGKVEKNLFNRFIQHLGLGHKMTSSLKLCQWFNKLDAVDLEFQFLELNKEEVDYLEDIENILWRKLKPLIGAEPRIK
ncbi:hypothetical protein EH230_03455 [Flavobacterium columnare]|uniref:Uncharacterized protein n=1 Tax=Flavobacterium columnare TaxID=996 RepID=A0A437U8T5_9FLAO|nr:hypothetical protein [Flavobacterium columnare]RVU90022.1 hypothetical protein EH230_03455 [Flavobacterium columnare]